MSDFAILFDLDGTLTDPKLGITRSIQYALLELGYKSPDAEDLLWCIGPPIRESFSQLLNTTDHRVVEEAIALYRRRYSTIGLWENFLYPEIAETLAEIRLAGYKTFVATSKPYIYAQKIIEHFNLVSSFDAVYGSEFDGQRSVKGELIHHILITENLQSSDVIMVGDRKHDIIGAKLHNLSAIGVTYGYGTEEELTTHGADAIAHTAKDIYQLILNNRK